MSGARYQLLSLTAAGLGVALGLGLGAGPMAEDTERAHDRDTARLSAHVDRLEAKVADLRATTASDAKVVATLTKPLVAGKLKDASVVVVVTPGARRQDVRAVRAGLESAGASVTGVLTLTDVYVDPTQAQSPLEDLALRLVPPGVTFPPGASPIERVGMVLARATLQRPLKDGEEQPPGDVQDGIDQDAAGVIAGLDELDALRLAGDPGRLADLAVVVSGPGDEADAEPALAGLVSALDAGGLGAVLAGPGAAKTGAVRWMRDDTAGDPPGSASTVDSVDTRIGRTALVLALAERATGKTGHYGLGRGARAVLPDLAPEG
jgi:hypothetical protein